MRARRAAALGGAIIGLGLVPAGATGARGASEQPTSPAPPPASASPDAAWAFAQQLCAEGEFLMAILEAKRLVYLYPPHPAAPEAHSWIGRIFAENLREYDRASSELQRVQQHSPAPGPRDRRRCRMPSRLPPPAVDASEERDACAPPA